MFRGRLHIGYLAAIVAASNAGGAGSVVGDTTTTMMWIDGVNPLDVLEAYVASGTALIIFGIIAARQQHKHHPIAYGEHDAVKIDPVRVGVVVTILAFAIIANVIANVGFSAYSDAFPWIGAAVWLAIFITAPLRRPHWGGLASAL